MGLNHGSINYCATLNKLLNISVPQLPQLLSGGISNIYLTGVDL